MYTGPLGRSEGKHWEGVEQKRKKGTNSLRLIKAW